MNKKIVAVMGVVCVVLIVVYFYMNSVTDHEAPIITIPTSEATYTEGEDESILLDGVTAVDNKDGDVSDTLRINSIQEISGGKAVVEYIAKDKNNNIAKKERTVIYQSDSSSTEDTTSDSSAETDTAGTEDAAEAVETEDGSTDAEEVTEVDAEEEAALAQASADEAYADMPSENPKIVLTATRAVISVGDDFTPLNYVSEITDDEDNQSTLYHNIRITGSYDTDAAGTYELVYYVVDSDNNRSNQETLTLTVTE